MEEEMAEEKIKVIVDADLEELIPDFMEMTLADVEGLKAAVEAGDAGKARSIGHSLKGSGGGYGFDEISEIGAKIENLAKTGSIDGVAALVARLEDYLARVEIAYE